MREGIKARMEEELWKEGREGRKKGGQKGKGRVRGGNKKAGGGE